MSLAKIKERRLYLAHPEYAKLHLESINAFYKIRIFSVFFLSALISTCFTQSALTLEYLCSKFPYLERRLVAFWDKDSGFSLCSELPSC